MEVVSLGDAAVLEQSLVGQHVADRVARVGHDDRARCRSVAFELGDLVVEGGERRRRQPIGQRDADHLTACPRADVDIEALGDQKSCVAELTL